MLDFGKHAIFVWGAYAASFVVLAGLVFYTLRQSRHD